MRRDGNFTNVINPVRVAILRRKGLSFKKIGITIAKQDGRLMPYQAASCYIALREFKLGIRSEDGDRNEY